PASFCAKRVRCALHVMVAAQARNDFAESRGEDRAKRPTARDTHVVFGGPLVGNRPETARRLSHHSKDVEQNRSSDRHDVHRAAHLVIAEFLGLETLSVSVVGNPETNVVGEAKVADLPSWFRPETVGENTPEDPGGEQHRSELERRAIAFLAGPVAEQRYTG